MMDNWQTGAAVFVVLGAAAYLGMRFGLAIRKPRSNVCGGCHTLRRERSDRTESPVVALRQTVVSKDKERWTKDQQEEALCENGHAKDLRP